MNNAIQTQPALTAAIFTSWVNAMLILLVAFGIDFTEDQTVAIMGAVNATLALASGWFVWSRSVSKAGLAQLKKK